jgi:hypothetical protein
MIGGQIHAVPLALLIAQALPDLDSDEGQAAFRQ